MAHTYTVLLYHIVFSTKKRESILTSEMRAAVFPYMVGTIANLGGKALIINGVADHVHILCRLKSQPDVAEVVQAIKGSSSTWFNKEAGRTALLWQEGYGAFSVSYSRRDKVYRYIEDQEVHHQKRTFAEEFEEFLVRHEVEYDQRFFLD